MILIVPSLGADVISADRRRPVPKTNLEIRRTAIIDRTEPATAQNLTIEDICLQAVKRVETLHALLKRDAHPTGTYEDVFAELRMLLEALPLNTDEFALGGNRWQNAAGYLKSEEQGAACYELKRLSANLAHGRHHRVAARRRRSNTCRSNPVVEFRAG